MRILRPAALVVASIALVALTACGAGGTPNPGPSGSSTATPAADESATPSATATHQPDADDEGDIPAAGVVVTGESLAVYAADGLQLFGTLYVGDVEAVIEVLTELLGDPVVTTTVAESTGCDSDQTMYDYGGLLVRSPGFIGAVGPWEVEVTSAATASGVPISTVGGQQVGATRAAFEAAIGDEVHVFDYAPSAWLGFDILNPEAPEFDWVGSLARFDSGTLVGFNTPYLIFADC
ncbi:hypothetical protein [Pseudolysinimonas sp.]|uniref:hypothetical protein n=1 Tax=Pseudolysinimonas sp. TaxID=2680009 RepID=UPI00286C2C7E|nr:hypothetical protein [Pseudolysinimonas sp.]